MSKLQAPALTALTERVREVLGRSGAADALDEALTLAQLSALPEQPDALVHFFENALLEALTGRLHPATARGLVDELLTALVTGSGSGTRIRSPELTPPGIPTVPPPPIEEGHQAYDDLASGAVHTRPTPVWGITRPSEANATAPILWILVSTDGDLTELLKKSAPERADVITVSSVGELRAALGRSDDPASSVVIDALHPSLALDQTMAALIEEALSTRIVLWRMDKAAHELLIEAVPVARTWLCCEAEVTPAEIAQLLRVV